MSDVDKDALTADLISNEALKTSEIEGEFLNRERVQSSIRRNFGLATDARRIPPAERGIGDVMIDLYRTFAETLTHEIIFRWHIMLTAGRRDLKNIGAYRTDDEPMQIISGPIGNPTIHFEAPPSAVIKKWSALSAGLTMRRRAATRSFRLLHARVSRIHNLPPSARSKRATGLSRLTATRR
jgi:Fic family protein